MELELLPEHFFVFDLDDTLYAEIDFLKSAYLHIARLLAPLVHQDLYGEMLQGYQAGKNAFQDLVIRYSSAVPSLTMDWLLHEYRSHIPDIKLDGATKNFLESLAKCNVPAGLITDGRSISQRNKLKALGLEGYFAGVVISEEFGSAKPDERNFLFFEHQFPGRSFVFFGDNLKKDFQVPHKLGWKTFCFKDQGLHIHRQEQTAVPAVDYFISSFADINLKAGALV